MIFKLQKTKDTEQFLKAARGKKHFIYRGAKKRSTSSFSETVQGRKQWSEIFKVLRERDHLHSTLHPAK